MPVDDPLTTVRARRGRVVHVLGPEGAALCERPSPKGGWLMCDQRTSCRECRRLSG